MSQDRQKVKRRADLEDLGKVMSTDYGRRVMWRLLSQLGVYRHLGLYECGLPPVENLIAGAAVQREGHWLLNELTLANWNDFKIMGDEAHKAAMDEMEYGGKVKKEQEDA